MDRGIQPGQDTETLIRLRNAIVHFKPEWDEGQGTHGPVSNALEGRFAGNEYFCNEGMFPMRWVGSAVTRWA